MSTVGRRVASVLVELDRGEPFSATMPKLRIGARRVEAASQRAPATGRDIRVATAEGALEAIANAMAGDTITLQPGTYQFDQPYIAVSRPGARDAPITVRAEHLGDVKLLFESTEGFLVSVPYWIFENLSIQGVCGVQEECEHAFHVVGAASHFVARNNLVVDFNAHFKINGERGRFPDEGMIEGNTLTDLRPRETERPVTPIDLVAASGWIIRGNMITDFVKAGGNRISYGAFVKGGGSGNRLERNLVVCELRLRGTPGWRVGLSLGGGGSGNVCRDGQCITEQDAGVIESNLITSCSDDGIYVNRGATSRVAHNTLVDTAGITVRFPQSSADVQGNLVDGPIRSRDGALLRSDDNLDTSVLSLYVGRHPQRALFRDPLGLDFSWMHGAPRRAGGPAQSADLCGLPGAERMFLGAFDDFDRCLDVRRGSLAIR